MSVGKSGDYKTGRELAEADLWYWSVRVAKDMVLAWKEDVPEVLVDLGHFLLLLLATAAFPVTIPLAAHYRRRYWRKEVEMHAQIDELHERRKKK